MLVDIPQATDTYDHSPGEAKECPLLSVGFWMSLLFVDEAHDVILPASTSSSTKTKLLSWIAGGGFWVLWHPGDEPCWEQRAKLVR